jgi:hypothetical protein
MFDCSFFPPLSFIYHCGVSQVKIKATSFAVAIYVPINDLRLSYFSAQPSRCTEVASYGTPPVDCVVNCVGFLKGISESIRFDFEVPVNDIWNR